MLDKASWLSLIVSLSIAGQCCLGEPPAKIDNLEFNEGVSDLVTDLQTAASSLDNEAYQQAVDKLIEKGADAVPTLRILLRKSDDGLKSYLISDTLRRMGPVAVDAIPELETLLKHEQGETRSSALRAVLKISPNWGEEHIDLLIRLLDDSNALVTHDVVLALWDCREKAKAALPVLYKLIQNQNGDNSTRISATQSLATIAPKSQEVVQFLIALLADEILFEPAAYGLANMGPIASSATPQLIELLDSDQADVQHAAIKCLRAIGPDAKAALPRLQEIAKDASPDNQSLASSAKRAMQFIQEDKRAKADELEFSEEVFDLVSDLHIAASSEDDEAYEKAVNKLVEQGANAVPTLRILLIKLDDGMILSLINDTLMRMGPVARDAVPELETLIKHENERTRSSALRAIKKISPQEDKAM